MKSKMKKFRIQPKLILGLVLMAIVLVGTLTTVVIVQYRNEMEEMYARIAFGEAAIAAQLIDGDCIETYYTTGQKDEYYKEIDDYLLSVKQNIIGMKYFYVVVPEDEIMVYIWDAGTDGEDGVCELLDTDTYYGDGNEFMHHAFSAPAFSVSTEHNILITNSKEYGYIASAYVPIYNSLGEPVALSSVDISMDKINSNIFRFVVISVSVAGLAMLLSIIAYYFYIRRIVIEPTKRINVEVRKLMQNEINNLDNFSIDIKTGDEFEELADAFGYMTVELSKYIKNLTSVTAEKERIGAELDVAKHIQASMLPCIFPAFPERHEFDIYASMTPAKEVGGDFYDFFLVDEDHLAIVMADVSGKGVPAALFMMISKTLIKSAAQAGLSPREVMEKVNNQLCENNEAGMFVTVWLGILEISTGKMICANAGHEYPAIKRKDGLFELFKDKHEFVLAGMECISYSEYELELAKGDAIFVYTDGVPEATNAAEELYGTDRMLEALNQNKNVSCDELLRTVHRDVDLFVSDAPQFDDITMLCLAFGGMEEKA